MEHLRDVRTRHLHALRKLRLRHPQLLHPEQYPPQKRRTDFINRLHSLQPTLHLNPLPKPTLLTSRRTDLDPAISQPRPDIIFHLRHPILPLSTSFAPPHHAASRKHKPFLKVVLGGAGVCPVKREFAHAAHGRYYPLRSSNKTFSTM